MPEIEGNVSGVDCYDAYFNDLVEA